MAICTRIRFAFLAVLAPLTWGQSFNIDVGDNLILFPVPQPSYSAAASQPGVWNSVKFPYNASLVALDGSPTSVTTTSTSSSSYNYFPSSLTGDDYNYMVDIQNLPWLGGPWTWTISGLANGSYAIYTYAWAPENTGFLTRVDVLGSSNPFQDVGGFWSGSPHVLGTTYALHNVTVTNGTLQLTVDGLNSHDGSVNGFQIVQLSSTATYCTSKVTSQGCVPAMGFTGVPSFSAGSGFVVSAAQIGANQNGLLFYSTTAAASNPFLGGTLCMLQPIARTPIQNSQGSSLCSGNFAFDFNSWIATGVDANLVLGAKVYAQYWFRDPPDPFTVGLTNALLFTIQP